MQHVWGLSHALDSELVALAKNGSALAFTFLYERHYPAVVRALTAHTRDPEVAADLTQDTFIAALNGLHRLPDDDSFRKWLFGIARNKRLEYLRRQRVRRFLPLDWFGDQAAIGGTNAYQTGIEHVHERDLIGQVLAALPSKVEEILLWHGMGLTTDEIAALLGVPAGTARKRLERARKLFHERYREADRDAGGRG